MSFGTYQPFNPTANTGSNTFTNTIGKSIADNLVNPNDPGSGMLGNLFTNVGNNVVNSIFRNPGQLPGAPSPEARQNVERSQAGGGILKLRQQPPMLGQQPGGKSSSGKAFAAPNLYNQAQPEQTQTDVNQTMGRPDVTKEMFGLPQSNFYNGQ